MNLNRATYLLGLMVSVALTACGFDKGGDSDQQSLFAFDETYEITGAGIKGPLAFANVSLYALDTNFDGLYDPNKPVATTTTNAYAEIKGLKVRPGGPPDKRAPYVLVIDGANAIDLNTNTTPVIKILVAVITRESLNAKQPVYATPYTTLAYHMLRLDIPPSGEAGTTRGTDPLLATRLSSYKQEIIQALGFGIPAEINILTTSPIITKNTTSVAQQQRVVYYRAAIEALSSITNEMSLATDPFVTTDELIQHIALDIYSDSMLDGAANGAPISGINTSTLTQNPMFLDIPNTQYMVSEITSLIVEERALVGASANVTFFDDDMTLDLYPLNINSGDNSNPTDDNSNPTDDNSNPGDYLLYADFDNRPIGTYAENDIRTDFQVNRNGYNDPDWLVEYMEVAADPVNSGRGNVLRVKRYANRGWAGPGNGGMAFRADFEKHDDIYLAYDFYVPYDHEFVSLSKQPGLMTGTTLQASHYFGDTPQPEGRLAFRATMTLTGNRSYSGVANADVIESWDRGEGSWDTYTYDADTTQRSEFWNTNDPTVWQSYSDQTYQYHYTAGTWITIEQRVKMNTVTEEGVSGLNDGLQQIWVTDPYLNGGTPTLVSSVPHRWRITNSMGIDGILMDQFYGGNGNLPENQPSQDQYYYYDNFRVSTAPITH